jgi:hypothetical protein
MRLLKILFILLVVIVVLLVGIAFLLPSTFSLVGETVIAAPPDSLYARFATPRTWADWSAWTTEEDPTLVYTYSGPELGVGAAMEWTGTQMGKGRLEVIEAFPGREVRYELHMQGSGLTVHGHVLLEPADGGTRIVWRDRGDFGANPFNRYFGPFMDRMMGAAYEKSFSRLRGELWGG